MPVVTRPLSTDAVIATFLHAGFQVVRRDTLRTAGISDKCIRTRLADGRMTELWHDVVAWGPVDDPVPRDTLLAAAVLEAGEGGGLFGTTALERLGAWPDTRHDGSIHALATRPVRHVLRWRIRFHQSDDPIETVLADRLACCHPAAAAFQASRQLTPHQLTFALRRLIYAQLLTIEEFAWHVAYRQGHRGVCTARRAIELYNALSAGTKSRSEDRALGPLTHAFGEPIVNVFGAAGIPDYEPDFTWLRERIVVEVDGGPHLDDPVTVERDRQRDALLRANGWIVIRVPWHDTRHMEEVIDRLRPVFASRR